MDKYKHCCEWCGKEFFTSAKYRYKYCSRKCREDARKFHDIENKKLKSELRKAKAKEAFLAFIKDRVFFIQTLVNEAQCGYENYFHPVRFEYVWACMRERDYHLANGWKIPCKEYLKDNVPESLKYIRDLS